MKIRWVLLALTLIACDEDMAEEPAAEDMMPADEMMPADAFDADPCGRHVALHEDADWSASGNLPVAVCDQGCDIVGSDRYYFIAENAGTYRFASTGGEMVLADACSFDANAAAGEWLTTRREDIVLGAGAGVAIWVYANLDIDTANADDAPDRLDYVVTVEALPAP